MTIKSISTNTIELAAVDLDGTLLDDDHCVSQRNAQAIRSAIAQGVTIVIATGKSRSSATDLIASLGINSPGIYMQGLVTYNADGSARRRQLMDASVAQAVIALGEAQNFRAIVYSDTRSFALHPDAVTARLSEFGDPPAERVPSWRWVFHNSVVHKVVLYGVEDHVNELRREIARVLGCDVHVTRANIEGMIEVLPQGTSKGHSLSILMRELNVAPENAMAIGDGENDIEMLQAVGIGIAMGNAHQLLKDVADDIVPGNDEDGVAVAFERYVIGEGVESR